MTRRRALRIAAGAVLVLAALAALVLFRRWQLAEEAEEVYVEDAPPPVPPPAVCPSSLTFAAPPEPLLPADSPHHRPPTCEPPHLPVHLLPTASPLWKRLLEGCEKGRDYDCFDLGRRLVRGNGGVEDAATGLSLLFEACKKGIPRACSAAGRVYASEAGAPFRPECSEILLQRGCDEGHVAGCVDLGRSLVMGWWGRVDQARGQALLDKHCPTPETCPGDDGFGAYEGPDDPGDCARGDLFACENASFKVPVGQRFETARPACEAGSPRGCWLIAHWLYDRPEARGVLEQACKLGELSACRELLHPSRGPTLRNKPPPPPPLSEAEHMVLREAACLAGSAGECRELAEACPPSSPLKLRLEQAACPPLSRRSDGLDVDGPACRALGDRYRKGDGVPRDGATAVAYYHAGCFISTKYSSRDEKSCVALAGMYEQGDGVPRDPARAMDLYAGLCSIGSAECRHYRRCPPEGYCP